MQGKEHRRGRDAAIIHLGDTLLASDRPVDDATPGGIRQCGEDTVEVSCSGHWYNHMVV